MSKTIFQKIIDHEIPARIAHEDELCIAIHDINPQAPVHVLVIPKKTIARIGAAGGDDQAVLGHLLLTAGSLARKLGVPRIQVTAWSSIAGPTAAKPCPTSMFIFLGSGH